MDPKDVQLLRTRRNLRVLADVASELSQKSTSLPLGGPTFLTESGESQKSQVDLVSESRPSNPTEIIPAVAPDEKGRAQPKTNSAKKGRAAVVTWDLSHNPAGRAHVLYQLLEKDWDVDLIGPLWERFGSDVWAPLRSAGLRIRTFPCRSIKDFIPKAHLLASGADYDVVYICKPRLPSLYLGALIGQSCDCRLILDIDDHELSFFENRESATLDDFKAEFDQDKNLEEFVLYDELGTRYAQSLIEEFDSVTVSNIALRQKFGGQIIRHARDENRFRPNIETRAFAREHLGIADHQFALIFIGTPRPHKGIFEVADALEEINDPDIVFHLVGSITDQSVKDRFRGYQKAQIVFHPDCQIAELPFLLSAADLVPLIQNTEHAISQFQIPAKISDATALGIPVLATSTPPVADLVVQGGVIPVEPEFLVEAIRQTRNSAKETRDQLRKFFLGELSTSVNRSRLDLVVNEVLQTASGEESKELPEGLKDLVKTLDDSYRRMRQGKLSETPIVDSGKSGTPRETGLRSLFSHVERTFRRTTEKSEKRKQDTKNTQTGSSNGQYNIVFFWKQNDTGLFGRRSDMVVKYLASSEKVGKILQLDAPCGSALSDRLLSTSVAQDADESLVRFHDRRLHLVDEEKIRQRTFVEGYRPARSGNAESTADTARDYATYVRDEMLDFGMDPADTIAWVCPVVWDATMLIEEIGYAGVVCDLIDDERAWKNPPEMIRMLETCYAETIVRADLVLANCQTLAETFKSYCSSIQVVPNGAERLSDFPATDVPEELADIQTSVVGYVGTLRDRIDWNLMDDVVRGLPDATFVFIGPGSDSPQAKQLSEHRNVRMLGTVAYRNVLPYLRKFDVAIVPHMRNRLTERMNPLKLYNYFSAGLPVVTTDLHNIDDLRAFVSIADDAPEFIAAIKTKVEQKVDCGSQAWRIAMDQIAWDSRVGTIVGLLDETFSNEPAQQDQIA